MFELPGKNGLPAARQPAVDRTRDTRQPEVLHVTAAERDAAMSNLPGRLREFRVKPDRDGSCTVVRLEDGSFMFHCGLRQGDIITHLNGYPVQAALREHGGMTASPFRIDVVRGGQRRAIEIHFDDDASQHAKPYAAH